MNSKFTAVHSWGRYPQSKSEIFPFFDRTQSFPEGGPLLLPHGLGRSYGDSCLNSEEGVLLTRGLNRFISLDRATGVMRCEAGVSFAEILELVVPLGWFLPVTPGTKFVTVGGAIANDVHGKNHHVAGNFGHHVRCFELLRSDGRVICSPRANPELFAATVGGLGLTGLMTWAEFQLIRIQNPGIDQEVVKYETLDEFFELSRESERDFDYTVSWVDCLATGKQLGRGHFIRGNFSASRSLPPRLRNGGMLRVPLNAPRYALNPWTLKAFNTAYYHRQWGRMKRATVSFEPFFYPLDSIHHWNRIYGKPGFLQYQCVVPLQSGSDAIRAILARISAAGMGSFLAVLKTFGQIPSLGMLSFPREGVTLALDFPNRGEPLFRLLDELDRLVRAAGGAVYPAKDARMSPDSFFAFFPRFGEFEPWIDPRFSSSFYRRMERRRAPRGGMG